MPGSGVGALAVSPNSSPRLRGISSPVQRRAQHRVLSPCALKAPKGVRETPKAACGPGHAGSLLPPTGPKSYTEEPGSSPVLQQISS